MQGWFGAACLAAVLAAAPGWAAAQAIGKIRTLAGQVTVERAGERAPAALGAELREADRIATGPDGSVGILLEDDSRLSLGPNSRLVLDRFAFDHGTHQGAMDVSIGRGTLSVVSGKITARTPGALKVRTPSAILAVRGTEFSVRVDEDGATASPK